MKILLLKDLPEKNKFVGDVIDVNKGYATNYLLKNKKGIFLSKKNLIFLNFINKEFIKEKQKQKAINWKELLSLKTKLEMLKLLFKLKLNEKSNTFFGAITEKSFLQLLKTDHKIDLKKYHSRFVNFKKLKKPGNYTVKIKLASNLFVDLKFSLEKKEEKL